MIPWGKSVNLEKIARELAAGGITGRMNDQGFMRHPRSQHEDDHGLTPQEQAALAKVVTDHDPAPVKSPWQRHLEKIDTYTLPEIRSLLREMLEERLPRQG